MLTAASALFPCAGKWDPDDRVKEYDTRINGQAKTGKKAPIQLV